MPDHLGMHKITPLPVTRAPLSVMPWTVRAWPPILWQAGQATPAEFHHLSTRVTTGPAGSATTIASGQTIWASSIDGVDAGMAWDWIEVTRGVVAMADPLSVITNLRVVGGSGEVLTALEAARWLNGLVHALPWQNEVERALATFH